MLEMKYPFPEKVRDLNNLRSELKLKGLSKADRLEIRAKCKDLAQRIGKELLSIPCKPKTSKFNRR